MLMVNKRMIFFLSNKKEVSYENKNKHIQLSYIFENMILKIQLEKLEVRSLINCLEHDTKNILTYENIR